MKLSLCNQYIDRYSVGPWAENDVYENIIFWNINSLRGETVILFYL